MNLKINVSEDVIFCNYVTSRHNQELTTGCFLQYLPPLAQAVVFYCNSTCPL